MSVYDHKKIEKKWQAAWEKQKLYQAETGSQKPKYYCLIEFPYPSGEGLHVGHARSFIAMDIVARKRRAEGYNVLYPIGWDAFGLPTENYALKTGTSPQAATEKNTATFRRQLKALGLSFDWSREINTTDPKYYQWTQWIFLKFYQHGLAYKKKMPINWCPKDKIGLANEEVIDNKCERCGAAVEKREKEQWLLAITKYADRLDKDLDRVDYLPEIKTQQRNWIGRSEGALISFQLVARLAVGQASSFLASRKIEVFTTRPDTIFGATFIVVSPELVKSWLDEGWQVEPTVRAYVEASLQRAERERLGERSERTGVFTNIFALNPATGEEIPVWVADYVLPHYGTGAIMAVPAHDQRDFEFAQKFNLPIKMVICPNYPAPVCPVLDQAYEDEGHLVGSGKFDGKRSKEARPLMAAEFGRPAVQYKLRDWIFSRQRYWGEPIPMVWCPSCAKASEGRPNAGWVAVPEKDLPVILPKVEKYQPTETGESPLAALRDWVKTTCPQCGGPAERETDTMPNWAGSSWYFIRYVDPKNDKALASPDALRYWLPVDWYDGGMEHVTLHLLYSRFWYKFLCDIGAAPDTEPYKKRTAHGLVLGPDGGKMSKSRGNVINPDDIVEQYGADTLRLYEMFMGPFNQAVAWKPESIIGCRRFIERLWRLASRIGAGSPDKKLTAALHQTIKKVSEDIETMSFNTAVAALMILTGVFEKAEKVSRTDYEILLRLTAPFAPHLAEELWAKLGHKNSIHLEPWPRPDPNLLVVKEASLVLQVNGVVRSLVAAPVDMSEDSIIELALQDAKIIKWLNGKTPKRYIYVKGKLLNFVV